MGRRGERTREEKGRGKEWTEQNVGERKKAALGTAEGERAGQKGEEEMEGCKRRFRKWDVIRREGKGNEVR